MILRILNENINIHFYLSNNKNKNIFNLILKLYLGTYFIFKYLSLTKKYIYI